MKRASKWEESQYGYQSPSRINRDSLTYSFVTHLLEHRCRKEDVNTWSCCGLPKSKDKKAFKQHRSSTDILGIPMLMLL